MSQRCPGLLLLYWFPLDGFAPSMQEHIDSFALHSRYPVCAWNTAYGFPPAADGLVFDAVVLHYSLFGGPIYWLGPQWEAWIAARRSAGLTRVVAFFQDEYRFWGLRYRLLELLDVDLVFSCFDPQWHAATYGRRGWQGRVVQALTGYVGERLLAMAARWAKPRPDRRRDVGYRARRLEEYMGRGAMEKHLIGEGFLSRAAESGLALDIATDESSRIYGEDWYAFLGDCRAVLGVEAGVSVVDTEDVLWPAWRRLKDAHPELDFATARQALGLDAWEDAMDLRVISPRHFEAAALGTVQVLFPGGYSGVLEPMRHYIPLAKDFSNLDEVIALLRDEPAAARMAELARREVVDSPRWTYTAFLAEFDRELEAVGLSRPPGGPDRSAARGILDADLGTAQQEVAAGRPWVGPHLHPRPHWPENLRSLRSLSPGEILSSGPHC